MSDEVYEQLRRAAKDNGYPGIGSYLLDKAGALTDDAEAADIVKKARVRFRTRPLGKPFTLRQLFEPDHWNGFSKAARIGAGRLFFDNATSGIDGLAVGPKSGSNHQTYVRTE